MQVNPVMDFPVPAVVNGAQRLVNEHQGKYSHQNSRILQQVTVHLLYL